jgi:transposase
MRGGSTGHAPHSIAQVSRLLGGEQTGKDPTNRGKLGTKRHVVVDRQGVPLAVTITGANVHDSKRLEEALDAIPPLRLPGKRRGRPRQRPVKLHADKGYDSSRCRRALRSRGIIPRIARRGIASRERLGRYRWVVERTLSWLNRFRRLKVRYERRADIHEAFLCLGCALVCWKQLEEGLAHGTHHQTTALRSPSPRSH